MNPPPPLGGRSVPDRNSRTYRLQSLSRLRTLCRACLKIASGRPSGLKFPIFLDFSSTFFCLKKPLNFGSAQNAPKSQKSDLGAFWGPILVVFGTPFGTHFLYISRLAENVDFATSIKRNARFYLPNPLILGPNFDQNFMFFLVSFLDTLFRAFFQDDAQKRDFGDPFGIQFGTKWRPISVKWRQKGRKKYWTLRFVGVLKQFLFLGAWTSP